ncbi:4-hydroxybenzoate transporter [Pseudomonas chlororaphis]|nr:4-hydroxybenzoate transporter [Pseudomonas chlororaphis]
MHDTPVVDVKQWVDSRPISPYQWLVLILCFCIITFDGYDAAVMGFIAPALIEDWGIARADMGQILGAGMLGVAIGALIAGPYADRLGRKRVLLASILVLGVFSLLSALARNPLEMAVIRFFAGLGLGAIMPNCVTLACEYMPERRRGLMITLMYSGFNIGSGLGGFIAAGLVPAFGWQSALLFGGLCPLLLLLPLLRYLPESALFMVVRGYSNERIGALLRRAGGVFSADTRFVLKTPALEKKAKVLQLFSQGYARGTLVLWVTYFMGLFVIYLLNGWLPTIIRGGGFSLQQAAIVAGLFQFGGTFGALIVGALMDRFDGKKVIAGFYFLGMACLLTQGLVGFNEYGLAALVFLSGFCVNGAQTGMQAFSPSFYPTAMRATGVSWMHGIGRSGAIISSSMGGVLLGVFPGANSVFIILAVPALCAALAILNHRRANPPTVIKGAPGALVNPTV